jgi:hypothetical protein
MQKNTLQLVEVASCRGEVPQDTNTATPPIGQPQSAWDASHEGSLLHPHTAQRKEDARAQSNVSEDGRSRINLHDRMAGRSDDHHHGAQDERATQGRVGLDRPQSQVKRRTRVRRPRQKDVQLVTVGILRQARPPPSPLPLTMSEEKLFDIPTKRNQIE